MERMILHLESMAKEIRDILSYFMLNHSEIEARKPYDEIWCMGPEGDRYYEDMDSRGQKLQAFLIDEYGLFYKTLLEQLAGQSEEMESKLAKANTVITRTIEHKLTFAESSRQGLNTALNAFMELEQALSDLRAATVPKGR